MQGGTRHARLFIALTAIALLGGTVMADPASALAEAQRHFDDLDYELVLGAADAIVKDPAATVAIKVKALYLRGSALVVLERDAETAAAFEALLALQPEFRPPATAPPRIRAAFESARAAWRVRLEEEMATRYGNQLKDLTLSVEAPARARGGQPLDVHVRLTDPNKLVARVVLGYRRDKDRDYSIVSASATPDAVLRIPAALLDSDRDYKLAWYVHAVHASGATLRREGDDGAPRWLAIAKGHVPGPVPITKRWWFWTGAAALAVSAVAVPLLIDQSRDVGPQTIQVGGR